VAPQLQQSAFNSICKGESRVVRATFETPTSQGNLLFVSAVITGGWSSVSGADPAGFTLIRDRFVDGLQVVCWYREGAPATSSVEITVSSDRAVQLRAFEYSAAAQTNALDKVTVLTSFSSRCDTGTTGNTAQADSIVIATIANRYASTTQSGFTGGLIKLFESVTPQTWHSGSNSDSDRSRCSHHHFISNSIASWFCRSYLSSQRGWIAILCTFKGGSSGPKRMSSLNANPVVNTEASGGSAVLSAFGPLKSTSQPAMLQTTTGGWARIAPANYQYLLNGWTGLRIGHGTQWRVESVEGLEGWVVRTSDDDLPRGDGALRGVDLQGSRLVQIKVNTSGTRAEVEDQMDTLYRALLPQKDQDWELIWRHPGRPVRILRCRPVDLTRELNQLEALLNNQVIQLRAADPRHYSVEEHTIDIPVTPSDAVNPVITTVTNAGNGPAYPEIRVISAGDEVTRVLLENVTHDLAFDVRALLPDGSALVGDMEARATGAPRSIVTIDGISKYGGWQHPRDAFRLNPGANDLQLSTEPAGADVEATITYRDTWSG
jgi:hypothetical protein